MTPILYWSPNSPYVRKVMFGAREMGVANTFEIKRGVTGPTLLSTEHDTWNPSGKVPTLVVEGSRAIFGSQAILQYLNSLSTKRILPPETDTTRYDELTLESLADGLLDSALLLRYELGQRPKELHWDEWIVGQKSKITRALKLLYQRADHTSDTYHLPDPSSPVLPLGGIAVAAACHYLDLRFPEIEWRQGDGANLGAWYNLIQNRPAWNGGTN